MQSYPPETHVKKKCEGHQLPPALADKESRLHNLRNIFRRNLIWKGYYQTDQSLFTDVPINYIFESYSSLKEFNSVAGFVSESFHLNRIPLSRQS